MGQSNYLAACQKLGIIPEFEPEENATDRRKYNFHARVIEVCVAAENAIEQPDGSLKEWKAAKDGIEITYEPWFIKSGSGWACNDFGYWDTETAAGPRLEFRTLSILKTAVKKLLPEYNNYFNA